MITNKDVSYDPKTDTLTINGVRNQIAGAAEVETLAGDVGDKTQLNTTDKSSTVAAINEVNVGLTNLNSRVVTSGDTTVQSVDFKCRSGYGCVSVNAFVQQYGSVIFDILVSGGSISTKDRFTGLAVSADVATFAYNNGMLTITFSNEATYTATFQTPYI